MTNKEANQTLKEADINLHRARRNFYTWSGRAQTNPGSLTTKRLDEARVELRTAIDFFNKITHSVNLRNRYKAGKQ